LTWQVTGGGTVAQTTTTSSATTGQSQNSWTLGTSGAQSVTVSEPGGSSVTFTATIQGTGAFQLGIASGDGQTAPAGSAIPLVVQWSDVPGNPGPVTTLTWAVTGGGSMAATTTTTDGINELFANSWTLGTAGTPQTVTVSEPGGSSVTFTATATPPGGSHPKAEIRAYNGSLSSGVSVTLQTPYDGTRTLGPMGPNVLVSDSLQVEVGVQFIMSSTIGGKTGTVTCTTTAAIIPDPNDPINTGNALVAVFTDLTGTPTLTCNGNGWQ
jgi:hypothetical protein